MKVNDVLMCMPPSDRLAIVSDDGEILYKGYVGLYHKTESDMEVEKLSLHTEVFRITLRDQMLHKTEMVVCPPDQWTDMQFKNLEFLVYTKLIVKK